ncbi:MAG TPA: ABC transporter ATP-binding protein [Candidatus Merdivicinus faecavium]|nr:ABC transporter ATP-binding protein [Candidatus Merdivicinus faecavium]
MEEPIFASHQLTKRYRDLAVDHITLEIKPGQIFGLVGKNGAGKTTLIRMITGQTFPTSGDFTLFGQSGEANLNKMRRRIGCMVETPSFFPYLSAQENLEFYRIQRGIPGRETVNTLLRQVGLADTGKKKFKNFSLGMKQRLGLALALLGNPDFLVLDEPINGLDPMGIVEFRDVLLQLNREHGTTILISSHILSELANLATDYAFVDSGRLLEQISAAEIRAKCRDCLEIAINNAPQAAAILENAGITDFEVLPGSTIRLYSHIDDPQTISGLLVNGGVALLSINTHTSNLEDYFLNLMGGKQA